MYRASEKIKQMDLLKNPRLEMGKRTKEIFDDHDGWHNRFRTEITNRIDEDIFKPLFKEGIGAPNAPIRILIAMMVLKEGQGISDEHLYEQARFNILTRSALGLLDSDEEVPTESTYYLFRQKISEYSEYNGRNLFEEAFAGITREQSREYHVSGKRIRMDSKLLGSNIGWYSRYGIVHESIRKYCAVNGIKKFGGKDNGQLAAILKEKAEAVTYRSTKDEVTRLFEELGMVMYRLLTVKGAERNVEYSLLNRVFEEQYELSSGPGGGKKKRVKTREKTEVTGQSVQNPHDHDSEYRDKGGNKVKGYSLNVTETCDAGSPDERPLNLIVDVSTEGSGTADVEYLQESIEKAQKIVMEKIKEVYTDGGYHSPDNQDYCSEKKIKWVLHGIQGKPSKYDLSFSRKGNMVVINTETGQRLKVKKAKSQKVGMPERWKIKDDDNRARYFERKDVEICELRKRIKKIPKEQQDIRNNVEATIFQLGYHYRSNKSRYRGLIKHRLWSISRCLWVNFRRIHIWKIMQKNNNGSDISIKNSYKKFLRNFLNGNFDILKLITPVSFG
jgi:hypothetical protein